MLKLKIVIVGCHDEHDVYDETKVNVIIIKLILTLIFPPSVAL